MSTYLDTQGNPTLGIGICARCARKFSLSDLSSDPNSPGLMVCDDDMDDLDPYRVAPRASDQIVLPFVRPDTDIDTGTAGSTQLTVSEDGQRFLFAID